MQQVLVAPDSALNPYAVACGLWRELRTHTPPSVRLFSEPHLEQKHLTVTAWGQQTSLCLVTQEGRPGRASQQNPCGPSALSKTLPT